MASEPLSSGSVSSESVSAERLSSELAPHDSKVGQLYDKLFSFEVKKADTAYPIHKKLSFGDAVFNGEPVVDIYQWLIKTLELNNFQHILDAGCGVGFGCQTLARHTNAAITGISLSADEVEKARQFASENPVQPSQPLSFQRLSFDDLPANQYDCILMVESVKHCADLDNALASVANALTDDGVCYIVEDIYDGSHTARAQQLADDWHLKKLWGLSDFQQSASLAGLETQVHSDLTDFMNIASRGVIATKLGLFSLFSRFSRSSVMPIYRGGFILDWLYAKKQMRYQLLALRKRPVDNASGLSQQGSNA